MFSYHYYNGLSDRLASVMPNSHWDPEEASSEDYLITAMVFNQTYKPFRDKYAPGKEMWGTKSGDAGGGGDSWASTYLDVLRTLKERTSFTGRAMPDLCGVVMGESAAVTGKEVETIIGVHIEVPAGETADKFK